MLRQAQHDETLSFGHPELVEGFSNSIKKKHMKSTFLIYILVILYPFSTIVKGQAPNIGSASSFALFTVDGAFSNTGNATLVTGDAGTNIGAFTAFPTGTIVGQIHVADAISTQTAIDVTSAYNDLKSRIGGSVISTTLEGQHLLPGLYKLGAASSLNGDLVIDGGGDPDALFIIQIDGALLVGASIISTITLINKADASNVYWQINGQFELGAGSVFRGTILANGAIDLLEGSTLLGKGLSVAGAIFLHNNIVTTYPLATGTITGTANVCQSQTSVTYSVPTITNASDYIWTLPTGAIISSGTNTNSITVDYGASAVDGIITVQGSNAGGLGIISANYSVVVNPVTLTSAIYHY